MQGELSVLNSCPCANASPASEGDGILVEPVPQRCVPLDGRRSCATPDPEHRHEFMKKMFARVAGETWGSAACAEMNEEVFPQGDLWALVGLAGAVVGRDDELCSKSLIFKAKEDLLCELRECGMVPGQLFT